MKRKVYKVFATCCAAVLMAGLFTHSPAVTRWSALQHVPNADMIPGGRLLVDVDLLWNLDADELDFASPLTSQRLQLGFSEWVGMDIGYADGFFMGLKARVLRENLHLWYVPSIAVGVQNIYTNREGFYFDDASGYPRNEFYIVGAKSSEWAMLRLHAGVMSASAGRTANDKLNPFGGIEKYFGYGLYVTAEAMQRDREFLLSLFLVYRAISDRFEFSAGVFDVPGTASERDADDVRVYRPTLRAGLRVLLGSGMNTLDGLGGIEDRIDRQRDLIRAMDRRIDSVVIEMRWSADRIHELSDLPADIRREERARVIDELTQLRNLYDQDPFDPELVRLMIDQIGDRYEFYSPHLRVIITDPEADLRIRRLAISLIGDMRDQAAANILISLLDRFEEPSLKIDVMIALGKLRETRARDALLRLLSDSNSAVAFTAREIYNLIFESGASGGGDSAIVDVDVQGPRTAPLIMEEGEIPEQRIRR